MLPSLYTKPEAEAKQNRKKREKYFAFHNTQRKIINIQLHSQVWTKLYGFKNAKMKMNETLSCLAIK